MRKIFKIILCVLALAAVVYMCLPYYARQALIHWMPDIDDVGLFARDTVHAPDSCWDWAVSSRYNTYRMSEADSAYLSEMETVSFLVIQHDSILYERYYGGWNDTLTSNLYSCTKSIVSLLAGVALDEGYFKSLDDPVGNYIPEYREGNKRKVTLRHLLTMSGGMDWNEAYASLFSVTTRAYYGDDLRELVTSLEVVDEPGVRYDYRSGETQLLGFAIEAATGRTLSEYAEEKLWKPMLAGQDAFWLLDKKNGDEKSFCCYHTTAKDAARFARLMLRKGDWNGRQLVSRAYMEEATSPASYLKDQWGKDALDYYGFSIWIMHYKGQVNPYFRGIMGQYIIAIPSEDAIVVRLGRKRSEVREREMTADIYRYMDVAMDILSR